MTLFLILWQGIVALFGCAFWLFILWLVTRPPQQPMRRQPVEVSNEFYRLFGQYCVRCGATYPLEWDHILPLSQGGSSDVSNLQRLCHACNQAKAVDYVDYRTQGQKDWVYRR